MADTYKNFAALRRWEHEGKDYRVRFVNRSADVTIIAPHGGKIERGSSEVAHAIAGRDHNFCAFEGIRDEDNSDLHITSTNFDEPICLDLVKRAKGVVAVHGLKGDEAETRVGGRDKNLRSEIRDALNDAGFDAEIEDGGPYGGSAPNNICNRGRTHAGVQLELTKAQRDALLDDDDDMAAYARAVRKAIARVFED